MSQQHATGIRPGETADASQRDCRQALEALRNGVPNRAAVRLLGCNQEAAEARFRTLLDAAPDGHRGLLLSGDFGSGKSHVLAHFQELALAQGFVCSKVAVSKETPLYDLGKVFAAAVESALMPDRGGRLIEELGEALRASGREYALLRWAEEAAAGGTLSGMFPATLTVYQDSGDPDLKRAIESFWAGDRILLSRVRAGLREIGQLQRHRFRAPRAAELPGQRLRFALELVKGAGYRGWVVLLDELELIGSYSILQRGRAYAEVARWLGEDGGPQGGIAVAGALTEDFASAVISADGKQDCDNVRPRLLGSLRHAHLANLAEAGMRALRDDCVTLRAPTDADVTQAVERLRGIYGKAHGWAAPALDLDAGGAGFQGRMRYKVRAAINAWDLRRLFPEVVPETEAEQFAPNYREDRDLEGDPEGGTEQA